MDVPLRAVSGDCWETPPVLYTALWVPAEAFSAKQLPIRNLPVGFLERPHALV